MSEARKLVEAVVAAFQRGDIPCILDQFAEDCTLRETQSAELATAKSPNFAVTTIRP
jgi:hypothetical protein